MESVKLVASTEVKIDKGIPMPEKYGKRKTFPFERMEVGDSFEFIPTGTSKEYGYTIANHANLRYQPKKFVARMSQGKTRIWRIA